MDCKCVNAKVSVTGDVHAKVSCDCEIGAAVSVGTVTIRDGTNDYNKLVNKPSIEGNLLDGDKTYSELGLDDITPQEIDEMLYG